MLRSTGAGASSRKQRGDCEADASLQFVKHCARIGVVASSNDTCPVCRTAEIVCGKWTLLVIRDLAEGRSRFCELERSLHGISPRTLSLRLRALEEEGVVERQTFPEVPPRVEYALTDKGRALVPLIEDMRAYGLKWLFDEDCGAAERISEDHLEPAVAAV
jgi:DNA-binding HxlR family transcriptional regulator